MTFKQAVKQLLQELIKYKHQEHIIENIVHKFQDDNVEELELK